MTTKFEFFFNGHSDNQKDYNCGMHIEGDPAVIGRMLAEWSAHEIRSGHPEPLKVLMSAFETMRRLYPGIEKQVNGILHPYDLHLK